MQRVLERRADGEQRKHRLCQTGLAAGVVVFARVRVAVRSIRVYYSRQPGY